MIEGPVEPLLHEYVVAPLAVSVAVAPEQIVAELTDTFKAEPIVTLAMSVPEQPLLVPVTV